MIGRPNSLESPAVLVAIIVAARRAGDKELEREARNRLEERFGVKLFFARTFEDQSGVAND